MGLEIITLEFVKTNLKFSLEYIKSLFKWIIIAAVIGALGGVIGSVFHIGIDYATELRAENSYLIFFLPLGGLLIAAIYNIFRSKGHIDTNRVIEAVRENEKVPLVMVPLIFVSTIITHLFGGSAGREGAALQLGGSIGYNVGRLFRLNKNDLHIIVMSGMSSVFAALFGTPLTAAIFSIEVSSVGVLHYAALLPCIIASITAYQISLMFGITPVRFNSVIFGVVSIETMIKVIILAVLCAIVGIIFCTAINKCEFYMEKLVHNKYLRAVVGGVIIVLMTVLLNTYDYNGAGMDVVKRAISGEARPEAFILKIIFTAITISAGFKGGEIVPAFFIGSTFGCAISAVLGLDAGFAAAMGFTALFCSVVNCPLASIILSLEMFGSDGILFFAAVCAVSYMMSGYFGLYKSQKIVYSKLNDEYIDVNTK